MTDPTPLRPGWALPVAATIQTELAQTALTFICPYDEMPSAVVRNAGPCEIVSASFEFVVPPTAYGRDASGAIVAVLMVIRGEPNVVAQQEDRLREAGR